jgi:ABC-2 type transport system permease protein
LILQGWSEALPHVLAVIAVMIVFDAVCLYGGAKAFRRAIG